MINKCCANCTKYLKLTQFDNQKHCVEHIDHDGFVCLAFASEGKAIWWTGLDSNEGYCEVFLAKEVKNET